MIKLIYTIIYDLREPLVYVCDTENLSGLTLQTGSTLQILWIKTFYKEFQFLCFKYTCHTHFYY